MASIWKRGKTYYARYYVGGRQKAICLGTSSYPIAKEKLRQLESKLCPGSAGIGQLPEFVSECGLLSPRFISCVF